MYNPFMFSQFSFMPRMCMSFTPLLGFGLGFGLGNFGMNLFSNAIFNYGQGGGGYYQAPIRQDLGLAAVISDNDSGIQAQLKKLGDIPESEVKNYSIEDEPEYQEAIKEAKSKKKTAEARLAEIEPKIKEFLDKGEDIKPSEDFDLQKLKNEYSNLARDLAEGGKYDKEIAKAEKAKADREKEIKAAKEKIAELQEEKENAKDQLRDIKGNQLDGGVLTQTSTKQFAKMYDLENNCFRSGFDASKIKISDLNHIMAQWRNSRDANQKRQYEEAYEKIYNDPALSNRVKGKCSEQYDFIFG